MAAATAVAAAAEIRDLDRKTESMMNQICLVAKITTRIKLKLANSAGEHLLVGIHTV